MRLLLRRAEVAGSHIADVRLADGTVSEIAPTLSRHRGEPVVDCAGGALLPGLVDHHLHLHALAAHRRSVVCGPPAVRDAPALGAALAAATPDEHGWLRGVGYHESVAGELDADRLDRLFPSVPARIQHRSGALWVLNRAAVAALGLAGAHHPGIERDSDDVPTGRLWRADAWLRARLPSSGPPPLDDVGAELTGYGITSVTDATPDLDPTAVAAITSAMRSGALPQRVRLLGMPLDPPAGVPGRPAPSAGPYKIVLADSGLPTLDELTDRIHTAHRRGRAIAAHVVTVEALVLLVAALDAVGTHPGDRIEHAALTPEALLPELVRLGPRVVTQPGFIADRGDDYLRDVPPAEHTDLYRCRSLLDAGIPVALSSDAPYGPLDPWAVLRAAVERRTSNGRVVGPSEALRPADALDALSAPTDDPGSPTRLRVGLPADLVLLRTPRSVALAEPHRDLVRLVLIGGVRYSEV